MHAYSLQWCLTLGNAMDSSLPGSLCPWDSPGKNTGVDCQALGQGIFLAQGSNQRFPAMQADPLPLGKPAKQEIQVRFLGREYALEEEMATHSSILAWKIL